MSRLFLLVARCVSLCATSCAALFPDSPVLSSTVFLLLRHTQIEEFGKDNGVHEAVVNRQGEVEG